MSTTTASAVTDALFAGRIDKIDRPLAAAFVEIGQPERAFLAAKDARAVAGSSERLPIDRLLREGQRLIVQGVREPVGGKGPRVTSRPEAVRLLADPPAAGPRASRCRGGCRPGGSASAAGARPDAVRRGRRSPCAAPPRPCDDGTLRREHEALARAGGSCEREARERKRPGRLAADETPARAPAAAGDGASAQQDRRRRPGARRQPATSRRRTGWRCRGHGRAAGDGRVGVRRHRRCRRARAGAGPRRAAARRRPAADRGDRGLRRHRCRRGRSRGARCRPRAVAEIARQVRLRNLGGTIVVDFIDLPTRPQRQRLEEALKKAFRDDPLGGADLSDVAAGAGAAQPAAPRPHPGGAAGAAPARPARAAATARRCAPAPRP